MLPHHAIQCPRMPEQLSAHRSCVERPGWVSQASGSPRQLLGPQEVTLEHLETVLALTIALRRFLMMKVPFRSCLRQVVVGKLSCVEPPTETPARLTQLLEEWMDQEVESMERAQQVLDAMSSLGPGRLSHGRTRMMHLEVSIDNGADCPGDCRADGPADSPASAAGGCEPRHGQNSALIMPLGRRW